MSIPPRNCWENKDSEIRSDTLIGQGGNDGSGLTDEQLSTFKVVRTASHFECYGYFDCLNGYDNVTLSFGPCHWTFASCSGSNAEEKWEMPAFLAYMRNEYSTDYWTFFETFGLIPGKRWNEIRIDNIARYSENIKIQTENNSINLCGVVEGGLEENKYAKNWHSFYRFLMATRLSTDLRRAMWDFTRIRIRDILAKEFDINGKKKSVGSIVTSEKGVAMLLRWHIRFPGNLFYAGKNSKSKLQKIIEKVIETFSDENQAREDEILKKISEVDVNNEELEANLKSIYDWDNVPQKGLKDYYQLNLKEPELSSEKDSFKFCGFEMIT
ncbi:MAG: hypothetical protein GX661_02300 [Acholeplasmataceae bacterium]|nr:hypothetical protein [Acholeplasmataceae bacterium]